MEKALQDEIMTLVDQTGSVIVCSNSGSGYPNAKAMLNLEHEGFRTFFFSTNLSSKRTQQFLDDPRACIYFMDGTNFKGLMLVGDMEVCVDRESKTRLWREGFEIYYPMGIEDRDYCVFRFTARSGNYYHGLRNVNFDV